MLQLMLKKVCRYPIFICTSAYIFVALMPLHKKCVSYIIRVYTMKCPTEPKSVVDLYYIH